MAAAAAAQLLDELMGRSRNAAPNERSTEIHWSDHDVCKYYLCCFCPHELFVNTRADLGPCEKLHDDEFRKNYEKSTRVNKMGYEEDFLHFLEGMINDVERRIKRGQQRLNLNGPPGQIPSQAAVERDEKITLLSQRINGLVEQIESLGCEGKVEEAQGVMKLCEQLKDERIELERQKVEVPMTAAAKEMQVCDVCGAFLIVGDAKQRAEEHLMGKQHVGYARVRAYVADAKEKQIAREKEREERLKKEREEREKEREREREERKKRLEEREREREEREKERQKRRERKRSRSRDRKRTRSRSRDRSRSRGSRRSRSRSRSRRDRRRSRTRSKSRDRRRRSRDRHSRDRSRRSSRDKSRRSTDRSRSKSRGKRSRSTDRSDRDKSREKSRDKERSRDKSMSPQNKDHGVKVNGGEVSNMSEKAMD